MDLNRLIFYTALNINNEYKFRLEEYLIKNNLDFFKTDLEKIDPIDLKISKQTLQKLERNKNRFDETVQRVLETCEKLKIDILSIDSDYYPDALRYIEDPPAILYVRGENFKLKNEIAFVGARKHSAYGKFATNKFIDELRDYDMSIISGMAYGIDALAHRRALDNDMHTVAVLGCGVDVIYPVANSNLYMNIVNRGAVISEFSPGQKATKYSFPRRNRIISGLSRVVVVVEAQDKSGSLITARLAADQGKEVLSVPGNLNSIYSMGTNKLIRDGAYPLIEVDDILQFFPHLKKKEIKEELILGREEEFIIKNLKTSPKNIEELSSVTQIEISSLNSILMKLELMGLIEKSDTLEYIVK